MISHCRQQELFLLLQFMFMFITHVLNSFYNFAYKYNNYYLEMRVCSIFLDGGGGGGGQAPYF